MKTIKAKQIKQRLINQDGKMGRQKGNEKYESLHNLI